VHNNFYFLRQLSLRLHKELTGYTLVSCFSQNKDELVFEFNNAKTSFFIKADLQGDFTCLTFPESFHRARKNSIDLFNDVIMKKVIDVRQFKNERSFSVDLEDNFSVLFKMHGNKSNIVLLKDNEEIGRFKSNVPGGPGVDREIDWSKEAFSGNIEKQYFTIGKIASDKSWEEIQKIREQLENPKYYIVRNNKISFSLLPQENNVIAEFSDPFKAINEFYYKYITENSFLQKKNSLTARLQTDINQTKSWLSKTNGKLEELSGDEHYKAWGDLLMANLYNIEPGSKRVRIDNFYDNDEPVDIPLDKNLSPQKNAERYYRKSKNQQIEIGKLREGLDKKSKELAKLESELAHVESADNVKSLKDVAPANNKQQTSNSLPYREFIYKGFKIWVGKDAKQNDELTLKYSYKEDLWLHVRDASGSHVLLKHQAGKPFPKDVIEHAASIAAFFSKRKTEPLCAVIVIPKKFIRKRKGDPAGAVVVEREEVLLVDPKNPNFT
jgi:predicted ribosome quality control (RQC) complex YloA/Tae2 family protein